MFLLALLDDLNVPILFKAGSNVGLHSLLDELATRPVYGNAVCIVYGATEFIVLIVTECYFEELNFMPLAMGMNTQTHSPCPAEITCHHRHYRFA